jgi:hypothetical protein
MSKLPAVCIACLVAAGLSLIGMLDLPYGYYMFLRLVLCACAIAAGLALVQRQEAKLALVAWALALLYNPVFRVSLDKDFWRLINLVTAVGFVMAAQHLGRTWPSSPSPPTSGTR